MIARRTQDSSSLDIAGVWDIECAGWDRFLCGELLTLAGDAFQSWDEDEFFDALLNQSGNWYAHVGGRYDGLWFLDMCCRRRIPWSARMRGSGVLTATVGDLTIRDSFALVPMRLKKFAPLGGHEKVELGLPCECGDDCGGYCALERPLSERERKQVSEYLHIDCAALIAALEALETRAESDDITLKLTVGSSAWATARRWLELPNCKHDLGRYAELREGYFGGRTEVFVTRADSGHRFDIHSSYPAALSRLDIPDGEGHAYNGELAASRFNAGLPGIYSAEVEIADCPIPPLPCREPDRLLYPTGPISGTWTGHELRYAVESGLARITKIRRGYVWSNARPILKPYADSVWAIRDKNAAGDAADKTYAAWIKWLANSLTGDSAPRRIRRGARQARATAGAIESRLHRMCAE